MKISKKLLGLFMLLFATVLLAACGEEDLPPVFAGVGSASIAVFDAFDPLAGVTATDVEDGDLTADIEVTANTVDNLTVGTYSVSYSVEDSAGNVATATRSVSVNAPAPEDFPLAQYEEGVNLSFLDGVQKDILFAAAESYLLENVLAGVPLYTAASRVMFSSRVQLFSEQFNGVLGFGTAFSQLTADDSTVDMLPGQKGNVGEYTYRSSFSTNPTTLNPWLADDSVSSDFINTFTGGLYEFFFDASKTGYEILPSFAKSLPTALDPETINGKDYATVWQIPLRDDLTWTFHPNLDTSGFAAGFEKLDASDYLWTWKLALENQWFRAISGGGDFITRGIKGAAEFVAGTGSWEDVGVSIVNGNTIQLEFVSEQSEFDIVYGFAGVSLAALNQELFESLGADFDAREVAYGQSPLTVAANGPYYLDAYTPDQLITVKKNAAYVDADLYYYTGQQYRFISGSEQLFEEFLAGRLESASVPASRVTEFVNDPRVKTSPAATTWRLQMNLFGTEANRDAFIAEYPGIGLNPNFVPEPILAYKAFRQALYYGFDRYTAAIEVVQTYLPAHTLFTSTYFLDGSSGLSVRTGEAGAAVITNFGGDSNGYFPDAALDLFKEAVAEAIADGFYVKGTASEYTTIEISLTYASSGNTAAQAMVAEIEKQYEALLVDDENFVNIDIVVSDVAFPGNYYDYMLVANTDLGIGGISGSLLDAPGFLDTYSHDNRSGFTLNWGIDTFTANIPVSYVNLAGDTVYETWSFNALVMALVGKTYVRDGQEQESWTDPIALIRASLDMAGQVYESSADGSALAEIFEEATLAELAEDLGADSVTAYTVVAESGRNYLFIIQETFGEYTLYAQQSLITDASAAVVAYLQSLGYTAVTATATLLDDTSIKTNEYIQELYDTVVGGVVTEDVVINTVAELLAEEEVTDPNAVVYAVTWQLNSGASTFNGTDAFILLNINGYFVVVTWL